MYAAGAYRVSARGDGSDTGLEWYTGHALMTTAGGGQSCGVQGAALYRYGSLFDNADAPGLSAAEVEV